MRGLKLEFCISLQTSLAVGRVLEKFLSPVANLRKFKYKFNEKHLPEWHFYLPQKNKSLFCVYAVKAQTSLAPLSRFRGSRITTAHAHQCCRFQSYAKTVQSRMKLTKHEPTFLGSRTTDHGVWRLTLTAYWKSYVHNTLLACLIRATYFFCLSNASPNLIFTWPGAIGKCLCSTLVGSSLPVSCGGFDSWSPLPGSCSVSTPPSSCGLSSGPWSGGALLPRSTRLGRLRTECPARPGRWRRPRWSGAQLVCSGKRERERASTMVKDIV